MKKLLFFFIAFGFFKTSAQPLLVNTSAYAHVSTIGYDSVDNKIYYNVLNGCQYWFIPCAFNYTSGYNNLTNKHSYSDNTVSTVNNSGFQIGPPGYGVNNQNSAESRQTLCESNNIYTNFGYYFSK